MSTRTREIRSTTSVIAVDLHRSRRSTILFFHRCAFDYNAIVEDMRFVLAPREMQKARLQKKQREKEVESRCTQYGRGGKGEMSDVIVAETVTPLERKIKVR